MIKLRVAFKAGPFIRQKDIDFVFKLATLEHATEDILKCELYEAGDKDPYDVNIAILYAGYIIACEKKRKRKKYSIHHAAFWLENMSKSTQETFLKAVKELLDKLRKGTEVKDEKKK